MPETYDLVVSSPFRNYDFFAHRMRSLCGQMSLSFFFVNDTWVNEFRQKHAAGEIKARYFLDLTANQTQPNDPYTSLAKEATAAGAHVVDDPELTAASAHKAKLHQLLVQQNVPVPETIVVERSEMESFKLTPEIRSRVGVPFVVKPSWGDSGVGVHLDGKSKYDLEMSAEECPNSDSFLIQQRVSMKDLGRHKGWFRMYHICGTVIACWWDPVSHEYHLVTPNQVRKYKLTALRRIMLSIARISKMKKFSAEICLDDKGKFYAVDYVNADPDMNPRSFYENGVPDEVVRYIVWLLFNDCMRVVKQGQGFFDQELTESEADAGWLEKRKLEQRQQASRS